MAGLYGRTRYFRRRRITVLIGGDGKVRREMSFADFRAFKERWPAEVQADGLTLRTVWALQEVQP